jgi:adenosylhomocysteine nucleosidase
VTPMLIIVTGMHREARIVGGGGVVVVAGGSNADLADRIAAFTPGASAVLSIGIGGGLAPDLPTGAVVIATDVVSSSACLPADMRWRGDIARRLPDATAGTIAGSDTIVREPSRKAALHRETGAVLVDMESHVGARVAAAHRIPFAALRVVSDSARRTLPPAVLSAIGRDGRLKLGAVLGSIASRPGQIPGLINAARDSRRALASLRRCVALLGGGFACPYLG